MIYFSATKAFTEAEILTAQWHYAQILFMSSEFEEAFNIYHSLYGRINVNEPLRWYLCCRIFPNVPGNGSLRFSRNHL